jgi:hypothetical protein
MDFIHDVIESGRKVKFFNSIDDYNREVLNGNSMDSNRVTRTL